MKDVDNQFKVCKSDSGRMNLYLRPDEVWFVCYVLGIKSGTFLNS